MVPSRLRIPTPPWAEMPPTGPADDDTFRPFSHCDGCERMATSVDAHSFEPPPLGRASHEDDDAAPRLGLF